MANIEPGPVDNTCTIAYQLRFDVGTLICCRYVLRRGGLQEAQARWFFQQLILAMDFCHKMSISNRDIKLENTLLDNAEAALPLLKLCDFGYSINDAHSLAKTAVGTPGYTGQHSTYHAM